MLWGVTRINVGTVRSTTLTHLCGHKVDMLRCQRMLGQIQSW